MTFHIVLIIIQFKLLIKNRLSSYAQPKSKNICRREGKSNALRKESHVHEELIRRRYPRLESAKFNWSPTKPAQRQGDHASSKQVK